MTPLLFFGVMKSSALALENFKLVSLKPEVVMRGRAAGFILAGILCVSFVPVGAAQETGYFTQLGKTFGRGIKNIVSCPWEIPYTIGQYDRGTTNPRAFRDTAGFFDGVGRTATRLGCGVWDVFSSVVPGQQEGLPLKPETFF